MTPLPRPMHASDMLRCLVLLLACLAALTMPAPLNRLALNLALYFLRRLFVCEPE